MTAVNTAAPETSSTRGNGAQASRGSTFKTIVLTAGSTRDEH